MKTQTVRPRRVSRVLLLAIACLFVFFSRPIRSDRHDLVVRWRHADPSALRAAGFDLHRFDQREWP